LIQFGSRVKYQMIVAGETSATGCISLPGIASTFATWRAAIEDVKTARPEIKSASGQSRNLFGIIRYGQRHAGHRGDVVGQWPYS
jgi:hypothetical protein